jgi:hypothetical protein
VGLHGVRVRRRRELHEINYGGSTEEIRRYCLFGAQASGNAAKFYTHLQETTMLRRQH